MNPATLPEEDAGDKLAGLELRFPEPSSDGRDQDEEWCEVTLDGDQRRIRFHDYNEIYDIPGLYERLFYDELKCSSPRILREMIAECLAEGNGSQAALRVLDVGAGNGLVGEELKRLGAESIVGVDIIEEAYAALERDRPGLYDDYFVADLTAISPETDTGLVGGRFNCMTSVAALGFDDMPPEAFAGGYRYLAEGGLLAFTIKADFVAGGDPSGFSQMINAAIDGGAIEVKGRRRYTHRLSAAGDPIHYEGIVARKHGDLPGY